MKKVNFFAKFSFVVVLVYMVSSCAGTHDYLSNNFQQARSAHKVIAILPFDVRFPSSQNYSYKKQDRNNLQQNSIQHQNWTTQEQQGSLDMQRDLFKALAKQSQKGRYDVSFQDFMKTNKILETNHIMLNDIAREDKAQLARLLGVDAVIWGQTEVRISRPTRNNPYPYGRYNDGVETTASIYDAASGELMWSTNQVERPTTSYYYRSMETPHDLADRVCDYVAKNLPYRLAKR